MLLEELDKIPLSDLTPYARTYLIRQDYLRGRLTPARMKKYLAAGMFDLFSLDEIEGCEPIQDPIAVSLDILTLLLTQGYEGPLARILDDKIVDEEDIFGFNPHYLESLVYFNQDGQSYIELFLIHLHRRLKNFSKQAWQEIFNIESIKSFYRFLVSLKQELSEEYKQFVFPLSVNAILEINNINQWQELQTTLYAFTLYMLLDSENKDQGLAKYKKLLEEHAQFPIKKIYADLELAIIACLGKQKGNEYVWENLRTLYSPSLFNQYLEVRLAVQDEMRPFNLLELINLNLNIMEYQPCSDRTGLTQASQLNDEIKTINLAKMLMRLILRQVSADKRMQALYDNNAVGFVRDCLESWLPIAKRLIDAHKQEQQYTKLNNMFYEFKVEAAFAIAVDAVLILPEEPWLVLKKIRKHLKECLLAGMTMEIIQEILVTRLKTLDNHIDYEVKTKWISPCLEHLQQKNICVGKNLNGLMPAKIKGVVEISPSTQVNGIVLSNGLTSIQK